MQNRLVQTFYSSTSEEAIASQLIAKFGPFFFVIMTSCKHVPENFLIRTEYIHSIVQTVSANISASETTECILLMSNLLTDSIIPNTFSIMEMF